MAERFEVLGMPLEVRFSTAISMGEGSTSVTYCSVRRQDMVEPAFAGCAFLNPGDKLDIEMGRRYAFKRAMMMAILHSGWWNDDTFVFPSRYLARSVRSVMNAARKARWQYNDKEFDDRPLE